MGVEYFDGVPVFIPNKIMKENKEEKYYVSYNRSVRDYGVDTTALVVFDENGNSIFYILKGNHAEKYHECEDLKECIDYFKNNIEFMHEYSDKLYIVLVLDFVGIDSHNRPVYKEKTFLSERFFKCTDLKKESREGLCTASSFDGEPDTPLEFTKYKDVVKIEWRDKK